jgi:hypothetical protein
MRLMVFASRSGSSGTIFVNIGRAAANSAPGARGLGVPVGSKRIKPSSVAIQYSPVLVSSRSLIEARGKPCSGPKFEKA